MGDKLLTNVHLEWIREIFNGTHKQMKANNCSFSFFNEFSLLTHVIVNDWWNENSYFLYAFYQFLCFIMLWYNSWYGGIIATYVSLFLHGINLLYWSFITSFIFLFFKFVSCSLFLYWFFPVLSYVCAFWSWFQPGWLTINNSTYLFS